MVAFTDDDFVHFEKQGYVIRENFLSENTRAAISHALRQALPTFDSYGAEGPDQLSKFVTFPYPELVLNQFWANNELHDFARRCLKTEDIYYVSGASLCRYAGEKVGSNQGWHIDNGNNSLLPESEDRTYGQIVVWYWPDGVVEGEGQMCIVPTPYGRDTSKKIPLTVKPGTVVIFHNYIWHSGTDFTNAKGQRYSHGGMFARADHPWEGLQSYTNIGMDKQFRELIGTLTAKEREVFRFPPAGHAYYTPNTLEKLAAQYPGWNVKGEY